MLLPFCRSAPEITRLPFATGGTGALHHLDLSANPLRVVDFIPEAVNGGFFSQTLQTKEVNCCFAAAGEELGRLAERHC